jgi:hypothetical protein
MTTKELHAAIKRGDYNSKLSLQKSGRTEYQADCNRLEAKFRADAIASVGLQDHPKAEAIIDYCWQEGHASGYSEVANMLETMTDLFQP